MPKSEIHTGYTIKIYDNGTFQFSSSGGKSNLAKAYSEMKRYIKMDEESEYSSHRNRRYELSRYRTRFVYGHGCGKGIPLGEKTLKIIRKRGK